MEGQHANTTNADHDNQSDDNSYGTWGSKESNQYHSATYPLRPPPLYSVEDGCKEATGNVKKSKDGIPSSIVTPSISTSKSFDNSHDRSNQHKPGLLRAFIDTAIPRDLHDNTVNLLLQRGEYTTSHKATLLHHAETSDQYDLFAKNNHRRRQQQYNKQHASDARQNFTETTKSSGTTP
jgi:hypothetical protein